MGHYVINEDLNFIFQLGHILNQDIFIIINLLIIYLIFIIQQSFHL
jgi:hypothetical protein